MCAVACHPVRVVALPALGRVKAVLQQLTTAAGAVVAVTSTNKNSCENDDKNDDNDSSAEHEERQVRLGNKCGDRSVHPGDQFYKIIQT